MLEIAGTNGDAGTELNEDQDFGEGSQSTDLVTHSDSALLAAPALRGPQRGRGRERARARSGSGVPWGACGFGEVIALMPALHFAAPDGAAHFIEER